MGRPGKIVKFFIFSIALLAQACTAANVWSADGDKTITREDRARAQNVWLSATENIVEKSGSIFYKGIFSYLQKRTVLCEPVGGGLSAYLKGVPEKDFFNIICLVPFFRSENKESYRSGFEKPGIAFFDPEFNLIGLDCTQEVSSFGKASALLRETFEMISFDYYLFNWDSLESFCWAKINTLGFELKLYRAVGAEKFEAIFQKDLEELKKEAKSGKIKMEKEKMLQYSKNLDLVFGEALSDMEIEERGMTYFLFLVMEHYRGYEEQYAFLKRFFSMDK